MRQMKLPLKDGWGRPFRYLRISLTDRCQLACTYCMPERLRMAPREDLLSYEEILSLMEVFVEDLGVEKIRFTGGEPLLRRGVMEFLHRVRERFPQLPLGITTNGLTLEEHAPDLKRLDISVNVSLDTLRPERFYALTRRKGLEKILSGIARAREIGLRLKLNTVLLRGGEEDLLPLVAYARDLRLPLRFIEYMPVSTSRDFERLFLPEEEARAIVESRYPLVEEGWDGVARMFRGRDDPQIRVGFISTVSRPFCGECTRLRLTATGRLMLCLFDRKGFDLMPLVRPRLDRERLIQWMEEVIRKRPPGFAAMKDEILASSEEIVLSMRHIGG